MSNQKSDHRSRDESSVGQSPNITTPLSEIPTSNEAEGDLMNTTTETSAATLSEKELWATFLSLTITKRISVSPFQGVTVENYKPVDNVIDCGSYGLTDDLADSLAADLAIREAPDEALDFWIEDLENYVDGLKLVQEHFRALKRLALVMPPEPATDLWETDPAAYKAWEDAANEAEERARYRAPVAFNELEVA